MEKTQIPIIVGVTGHRNIVKADKEKIKAHVRDSLKEIQELCAQKGATGGNTPVIMLNAFAQGADMLCAEAAFELGIDVYALLPCPAEEYILSFDDEEDRQKLFPYLEKVKRQIIAPDTEKYKKWLKNVDADSYRYRQLGIYMAEHCHILLALWDGKPPKGAFGCGTVEVINFALKHNFLDESHMFKPGVINDSAVIWIKSRREGDPEQEITKTWMISNRHALDALQISPEQEGTVPPATDSQGRPAEYAYPPTPPEELQKIIEKTVKYNEAACPVPEKTIEEKLWVEAPESAHLTKQQLENRKLDDYRKGLRYHYVKADALSYGVNQKLYKRLMLVLAVMGMLIALFFLLYDDASVPWMIYLCVLPFLAAFCLTQWAKRRRIHKNYTEYRTFAEALRIQFYLSMCLNEGVPVTNVCDLCSWSQKVNTLWIDRALQALAVVHPAAELKADKDEVVYVWLAKDRTGRREGEKSYPEDGLEGQRAYHARKLGQNGREKKKYENRSAALKWVTVGVYGLILLLELVTFVLALCGKTWFWGQTAFWQVSWRNIGGVCMGVVTATTLLLSSYWGKLSFERQTEDNKNMLHFFSSAYARWAEVKRHKITDIRNFVIEVAREEIVENGNWFSYVNENRLEINI